MSKVRVVMAELDGTDAAVLAAIRSFLPGAVDAPAAPSVERTIEAPKVQEIAAPPVAATAAPVAAKREKKKTGRWPMSPLSEPKGARADAAPAKVAALLAVRPMTSGELIKALPEFAPSAVYAALSGFRAQGKIRMIEDPETVQKKNELVK